MSATDWHFFKVRPGNYPTRRITAMSYLLLRYKETGLPAGLNEKISEAAADNTLQKLEEALIIAPGDCRGGHPDFRFKTGENIPALLGKERAADIVINVLLPFTAAMGQINKRPEEEENALEIYHRYPAAAENTVVKDMRRKLGINGNITRTAQRQQGLLHIFKMFCLPEKCIDCPVSQTVAAAV
jgi:hypothetical protein